MNKTRQEEPFQFIFFGKAQYSKEELIKFVECVQVVEKSWSE